jgi:hypothetical protein
MSMPIYFHETIDIVVGPGNLYQYHDEIERIVTDHVNAPDAPPGVRCVANWVTVWATGRWPETVGLWEYPDWTHYAQGFTDDPLYERIDGLTNQRGVSYYDWRSGGFDRTLVPASFTPTYADVVAKGIRAPVVLQEIVKVRPGKASEYLDRLSDVADATKAGGGVSLFGAYRTTLRNNAEVINLWAFESMEAYIRSEESLSSFPQLEKWRLESETLETENLGKLMRPQPWSPLH